MSLPISKEKIAKYVEWAEDILSVNPEYVRFWDLIKIAPEKWSEKTMGYEEDGYWVVAIMGKSVIYYNNIEEGYNLSGFTNYGEIDNYNCSQIELHDLIVSLFNDMIR